ncbi:MAG TPA: DUF5995 family protein, partial [Acidobacteriaceae bacterium]|nr:DUF5995 family protein [Acidobacteriaceae bacterium]
MSRKASSKQARVLGGLLALSSLVYLHPVKAFAFDPAPWTALLLPAPLGYTPDTATVCSTGDISCVDNVLSTVQTQLVPLLADCDHKLIFMNFYQRMVQGYRSASVTPGFFENPAYTNQGDAVLSSYYFNQYQAWLNHDLSKVSPAWQIAFAANDDKTVSALGDVLLSVN